MTTKMGLKNSKNLNQMVFQEILCICLFWTKKFDNFQPVCVSGDYILRGFFLDKNISFISLFIYPFIQRNY